MGLNEFCINSAICYIKKCLYLLHFISAKLKNKNRGSYIHYLVLAGTIVLLYIE